MRILKFILPLLALTLTIAGCGSGSALSDPKTRTYYIAAVEEEWDYAPRDKSDVGSIETTYQKARYVAYTENFGSRITSVDDKWKHLGILGPIIRAEVDDTIVVHFKDLTSKGYTFTMDGVPLKEAKPNGDETIYTFKVPAQSGPDFNSNSSIVWAYHSSRDEAADENAGLIGPVIIYTRGTLHKDGTVKGVENEFVTLFKTFDENSSALSASNGLDASAEPVDRTRLHTINGYMFSNMTSLVTKKGKTSRWYLLATKYDTENYLVGWDGGNNVGFIRNRQDWIDLPRNAKLAPDMVAEGIGEWDFYSFERDSILNTKFHEELGTVAKFIVKD